MQNLFARDLSIESELFLAVCRTSVPSTRVQSWVERCEGIAVDWELVLRMAAKHRVMPLLHRQVQAQLRDLVPKSWYRRLENRVAANSERCERLASQLVQAQSMLSEAGIDSLAFKGTLLAERVYKDLRLRQGWDIDILVRHEDRDKAIRRFEGSGYDIVRVYDQAVDLVDRATGTPVDLHWHLTPKYFPYQENMGAFFERSIQVETSAGWTRTLCDEDLLAVLCLQIAKDAWERRQRIPYFFKVIDLAEAMSTLKALDWAKLRARAKENGWLTILQLAVGVCQQWLGCDESVCNSVVGVPMSQRMEVLVRRLGEEVVCPAAYDVVSDGKTSRKKGSNHWAHRLRQGLFFMQIRERPTDWMRYGRAVLYYGLPELVFGQQQSWSGESATLTHQQSEKVRR
jgi:hypothetical protein